MIHVVAHWLFHLARIGRCPCCGRWTTFSRPVPAAVGVPAELQALVPRIARCGYGCTSGVRAITGLERRS